MLFIVPVVNVFSTWHQADALTALLRLDSEATVYGPFTVISSAIPTYQLLTACLDDTRWPRKSLCIEFCSKIAEALIELKEAQSLHLQKVKCFQNFLWWQVTANSRPLEDIWKKKKVPTCLIIHQGKGDILTKSKRVASFQEICTMERTFWNMFLNHL